jgi:hypothetical protein
VQIDTWPEQPLRFFLERRVHVGEGAIEIDCDTKRHLSVLIFCFLPAGRRRYHQFPVNALVRPLDMTFA